MQPLLNAKITLLLCNIIYFLKFNNKQAGKNYTYNFSINICRSSNFILYHFGIEQGFFNESLACISSNEINNLSKEDLIKELQKEVVSCKDVQFTLLGLSLASINTLISLILSVITFKLFLDYEKNR